jgi:hypothetical protein
VREISLPQRYNLESGAAPLHLLLTPKAQSDETQMPV